MDYTTFWQETVQYASQVRHFKRRDWVAYIGWVGLMLGLFVMTGGFVLAGWRLGVLWPTYVWYVPIGVLIFVSAISFDTIGHRTAYRADLAKGEGLVHEITIVAGITSVIALVLGYQHPAAARIPALVLIILSVFYSVIDEGLHWHRYLNGRSDRVEMWSHFFIFLGHSLFIISWWVWFDSGYPGVAELLQRLQETF